MNPTHVLSGKFIIEQYSDMYDVLHVIKGLFFNGVQWCVFATRFELSLELDFSDLALLVTPFDSEAEARKVFDLVYPTILSSLNEVHYIAMKYGIENDNEH